MTLPDGAYVTPQGWVVIGDEALLPEDVRRREEDRDRRRLERYPDGFRKLHLVGSLHDGRCTGPTRGTGCRCKKYPVYSSEPWDE